MTTTTETRDQAAMRQTVDRLTEAIALLKQTAADMLALTGSDVLGATQIANFALSAAETADLALMVATNERKLAERR
ncbi:MAG TPA: hypothetical protein VN714_12775 [Trebonia sp.]|nr:hypothetical protein [Trebonia sp.]